MYDRVLNTPLRAPFMVGFPNAERLIFLEIFFEIFTLRIVRIRLSEVRFPDAEDFCRNYAKIFHLLEF